MSYKTPGVYVKEISIFPPSVAEVETAIPAFIGYTEKAERKGQDLTLRPTRIKSMLEYGDFFGGGAKPGSITVQLDAENTPLAAAISPRFYLHQSLRAYFANGGGDCYIVSVGNYEDSVALGGNGDAGLMSGLFALEKYDEPTIIVFPDAVILETADLYELQKAALLQCEKLQDRFAVFDLLESKGSDATFDWADGITEFRESIGVNALKYGAAYTPHLQTNIPIDTLEAALSDQETVDEFLNDPLNTGETIEDEYEDLPETGDEAEVRARIEFLRDFIKRVLDADDAGSLVSMLTHPQVTPKLQRAINQRLRQQVRALRRHQLDFYSDPDTHLNTAEDPVEWEAGAPPGLATNVIDPADTAYPGDYDLASVEASALPGLSIYGVAATLAEAVERARGALRVVLETVMTEVTNLQGEIASIVQNLERDLRTTNSIYAAVFDEITRAGSVIPPSGAVAGVYAYVDRTRGVWKAPANVSLSTVVGITEVIDHFDQESLNIDTTGGKSINAIRPFTGRGILVWGARTLAGNDNEWRYVPVRRFFNMVEESVKKSTAWAVFEPNDAKLWNRVKTMIENYLIQKWRDGALAGAKPDEAFFVKTGLGLTMTPQDILEGRLIIEIGMAVVRPAEFIILKFSHKMQES